VLSAFSVSAAAQPFLAVLIRHLFPRRPIVVVIEGLKAQESFHQDISTWFALLPREAEAKDGLSSGAATGPLFYPAWEILPHESKLPHADVISDRLETLVALRSASRATDPTLHAPRSTLVVTSIAALLQRTFPPEALGERTRTFARGDRMDPLDLVEWLEEQGYEPEAQATQKGELAARGGIVDVYPLTSPWPVRLEFFGDELESLRYYDPLTQISREEIPAVTIPPGGELGILKRMQNGPAETRSLGTLLDYLPPETILLLSEPEQLEARAAEYAQQIPQDDPFFIAWENFGQQAAAQGKTLLGVTEDEPNTAEQGLSPVPDHDADVIHASGIPEPNKSDIYSGSRQKQKSEIGRLTNHADGGTNSGQTDEPPLSLQFQSLDSYRPLAERAPEPQIAEAQRREFFAQLHRWLRQGSAVHVFCNNEGERQRFAEIWREYGLESPTVNPTNSGELTPPISAHEDAAQPSHASRIPEPNETNIYSGSRQKQKSDIGRLTNHDSTPSPVTPEPATDPHTHCGSLPRGFLCDAARLVVVTDAEIFGRYKVQRPRRLKSAHAQAARSALDIDFTELAEGDYVVHLQHGIGRYIGLQVLPLGAGTKPIEGAGAAARSGQECLVLEYAAKDPNQPPPKLYVPVTEAHLVGKYVGPGKGRPPLNTLGGGRWARTKEQAEKATRDVASDLLAIQAARESEAGYAFAADAAWQREFEAAFLFEETPDQMRAILETKADMERPKPMDRLICGDVGFGKTEVGIRAAFKAVMDGKQVAVLVPTTVLAQQHFNTFRERMADYPVRIELLSRFRTRRAQERVIKEMAAGSVDIVIGTHRLVQDDIAFKDLGLVVIDEEQRFGVWHKEKFKLLRKLVDVLTLSATPIPRTLYLALTGARDMSTIQTPPQDRLPVETIVTPYDERVIRDAIQRELNRGGQVFFLHNRVMTIEAMAQKLQALVPRARIVIGHGQMHSDDLEEVMTQFVNGEADVLLSTTIIESGLDIPNANTIIIDRADRFGLSDLYQLRGRVGRYKHQAYAYLLMPRHAGLLADARKRLSAIKQFSTLGSGFKIAMRDLEIRGAGNLLGSEQSGHIMAVGFELYCQLLKQSVAALKGEKVKPRVEVEVRLDFLDLSPGAEPSQTEQRGADSDSDSRIPELNKSNICSGSRQKQKSDTGRLTHHASQNRDEIRMTAFIPFAYISDARQRIEIYRKLAQATDKSALQDLEKELRDRFGPLPPPLELLLQLAELKILAGERGISAIEVKDDRLMLTRHGDYVMVGSKFPRLTRKAAPARLKEIKKLLLAL